MKKVVGMIMYLLCIALMLWAIRFSSSDGAILARSYSALNNRPVDDATYQAVHINYENPMIICTDSELMEKLTDDYTGFVYFGSATCPYCRNTLPLLLEVMKQNNIQDMLTCDLKKYNYRYEVVNGNLTETQVGTKAYCALLDLMQKYASEKVVYDDAGNKYDTDVKTIYMPVIVFFENGKPVRCWQYSTANVKLNPGQNAYDLLREDPKGQVVESLRDFLHAD